MGELELNPKVWTARGYAIQQHGAQLYGKQPYVAHLDAVYAVIKSFQNIVAFSPREMEILEISAYLHDLIEDTKTTITDIETRWGGRIANAVFAVTGEGPNRKARNESIYRKVQMDGRVATALKVADRIANCEAVVVEGLPDLWRMYTGEASAFREALYAVAHNLDPMWKRLELAYASAPSDWRK